MTHSVRRSVSRSVCRSVTLSFFQRFWAFFALLLLPKCLGKTLSSLPLPTRTRLRLVYTALFIFQSLVYHCVLDVKSNAIAFLENTKSLFHHENTKSLFHHVFSNYRHLNT